MFKRIRFKRKNALGQICGQIETFLVHFLITFRAKEWPQRKIPINYQHLFDGNLNCLP